MAPKKMATPQRTHPATASSFFDDTIRVRMLKSNPIFGSNKYGCEIDESKVSVCVFIIAGGSVSSMFSVFIKSRIPKPNQDVNDLHNVNIT